MSATTTIAGGNGSGEGLARALGWASVALAAPLLVVPHRVLRAVGLRPAREATAVARAVGAREMASAAGLLTQPKQGAWVWARVAGDAMDLALLTLGAQRKHGAAPARTKAAAAAVTGIAALDLAAGVLRTRAARHDHGRGMTPLRSAITISKPRSEVYDFWRKLENLPRFMHDLESVTAVDGRSRWVVDGPLGRKVEWDAEITDDVQGERIAWCSLPGSEVANRGQVEFSDAPGGRGTEVVVELEYHAPGGPLGAAIAHLLGKDGEQEVRDSLRRLKQILETGEVAVSDASPSGTRTRNQFRQRDAQPGA